MCLTGSTLTGNMSVVEKIIQIQEAKKNLQKTDGEMWKSDENKKDEILRLQAAKAFEQSGILKHFEDIQKHILFEYESEIHNSATNPQPFEQHNVVSLKWGERHVDPYNDYLYIEAKFDNETEDLIINGLKLKKTEWTGAGVVENAIVKSFMNPQKHIDSSDYSPEPFDGGNC